MLGATLGNMAVGMVDIPKDSLIFYEDWASPVAYPGATGTTVNDLSPSLVTGTLTSSPTFTQFTNGGYFTFNGTSSYITYGDVLDMLTNNRTMVSWVYLTALPTTNARYFIGKIIPSSALAGRFAMGVQVTTNKFRIAYVNAAATSYLYDSVAALTTGVWYMLVGVIDRTGGNIYHYINGALDSTTAISTSVVSINNAANFQIGAASGPTQYFQGRVGLSLMYNKALSATEILNIYNNTKNRYL